MFVGYKKYLVLCWLSLCHKVKCALIHKKGQFTVFCEYQIMSKNE